MAENKNWMVTTSGDRPLNEVQQDLTDTGFKVDQVYGEVGCISGTADSNVADKLRQVPGVADVSPEPPPINIGLPGDSDVW